MRIEGGEPRLPVGDGRGSPAKIGVRRSKGKERSEPGGDGDLGTAAGGRLVTGETGMVSLEMKARGHS